MNTIENWFKKIENYKEKQKQGTLTKEEELLMCKVTEVDLQQVENAVYQYQNLSLTRLQRELERLETVFNAAGGRGVDLADQIDNIRIAIAMRE